jgi:hypothetical protein
MRRGHHHVPEGFRLPQGGTPRVLQEVVEKLLLRQEHHRRGSTQPAAICGRATFGHEELDLQSEDLGGPG